jgi:hypothetical protein
VVVVVVQDDNVAFLGFDAMDAHLGDKQAAAGNAHGRRMLLFFGLLALLEGFQKVSLQKMAFILVSDKFLSFL